MNPRASFLFLVLSLAAPLRAGDAALAADGVPPPVRAAQARHPGSSQEKSQAERSLERIDLAVSELAARPNDIACWKNTIRRLFPGALHCDAEVAMDRARAIIAIGERSFPLGSGEAAELEDRLATRLKGGLTSDEEQRQLAWLRSGYDEGRIYFEHFLSLCVEMHVRTSGDLRRYAPLIAEVVRSRHTGAGVLECFSVHRVQWRDLPSPVQDALLSAGATGDAARSLAALGTCQRLGCPRNQLQPLIRSWCDDARAELGRSVPGPFRSAIRLLYSTDRHQWILFSGDFSDEVLELFIELARAKRATPDERIGALRGVVEMLAPIRFDHSRRDCGATIDQRLIDAAVGALDPDLSELDIERLAETLRVLWFGCPDTEIPSEQILGLLRSNDLRERAVGKMVFEALPGLHWESKVRLKKDLIHAALELRLTSYETSQPSVSDYAARPFEHFAAMPPFPELIEVKGGLRPH